MAPCPIVDWILSKGSNQCVTVNINFAPIHILIHQDELSLFVASLCAIANHCQIASTIRKWLYMKIHNDNQMMTEVDRVQDLFPKLIKFRVFFENKKYGKVFWGYFLKTKKVWKSILNSCLRGYFLWTFSIRGVTIT